MYIVFGATGHTGSQVATSLLEAGKRVRLVVRDAGKVAYLHAKGAEIAVADLESGVGIEESLRGAVAVYALLPPDNASKDYLARSGIIADNLARAFANARVPHVVFLSSVAAQLADGTGPIQAVARAERRLKQVVGTHFTFLRPAYFMENMLAMLHPMQSEGTLPNFGPTDVKLDMIATKDIATAAVRALLGTAEKSSFIELRGPAQYSINDVASTFARALGKPIAAHAMPIDALVPAFQSFGFSENVALLYRELTTAMYAGKLVFEGPPRLTATSLDDFATAAVA